MSKAYRYLARLAGEHGVDNHFGVQEVEGSGSYKIGHWVRLRTINNEPFTAKRIRGGWITDPVEQEGETA